MKPLFKFLNIISLVVLLLSCLAAYINPTEFWPLSFIGFAFPVVVVINVFFLLFWLLLFDRFILVPAVALLLSWNFSTSVFTIHRGNQNADQGIRIMTWNVKNFDLYNWSHNLQTRSEMMDLIRKENPDVLCLQEFYTNNQFFHNLKFMTDTLGYRYYYFPPSVELKKNPRGKLQETLWKSGPLVQQWGVATFSKFPIADTGMIHFNRALSNNCIYTDIMFGSKRVRIYNVHFQSIHLGYDDYATLDNLEEKKDAQWSGIQNIIRKMKYAYERRAKQAIAVRASMDAYTGTKMICGDFNDVPVSFTYHTVRGTLSDAFTEKGSGFGATFVQKVSIFRIDYLLHDPNITIHWYRTIRRPLSDHYAVIAGFSL